MKMLQQRFLNFFSGAMVLVVLCGSICVRGQQTQAKWERVYTGEDSVIEINVSSMKLEPERMLRVQFRTILSEPESLKGTPDAKYKIRLETIAFRLSDRRYRFSEITLLDPQGKPLYSYESNTLGDWRVLKPGGVTERLFNAARALPPFGTWKAVTYRLAEGALNQAKPAPELEKLIGTRVRLSADRAEVGARVCSSPVFENKRSTKEELFQNLGIELKVIGVKDSAEAINVRCEGSGWQPPQSVIIKVSEGEMLMLWDGVFLVLKRAGGQWTDNLPTLKTRGRPK